MPENNHAGRKRSMPQDGTAQPTKSKVDVNYGTIFKQSKNMEISNKQLKAKVRNLQQQLRRCKTIELDKHWNDNSSIRSDLRVNLRWRKLMYDNYEGRKCLFSQLFRTFNFYKTLNGKLSYRFIKL